MLSYGHDRNIPPGGRGPAKVGGEVCRQRLNRFARLRDGTLAIGTILAGLYLLTPDGSLATHLTRDNGLQNKTVLALHEDRAGDLWLGLDRGTDLVLREGALRYYSADRQAIGSAAEYGERFYLGANQGVFSRLRRDLSAPFTLLLGSLGLQAQVVLEDFEDGASLSWMPLNDDNTLHGTSSVIANPDMTEPTDSDNVGQYKTETAN